MSGGLRRIGMDMVMTRMLIRGRRLCIVLARRAMPHGHRCHAAQRQGSQSKDQKQHFQGAGHDPILSRVGMRFEATKAPRLTLGHRSCFRITATAKHEKERDVAIHGVKPALKRKSSARAAALAALIARHAAEARTCAITVLFHADHRA